MTVGIPRITTSIFESISKEMDLYEAGLSNPQRSILLRQLEIWVSVVHGEGVRSSMNSGRHAECICAHMMSPNGQASTTPWTCPRHGIMIVD